MLGNIGSIIGIISGAIVILIAIVAIVKGGFNIFGKINKIDNIEKATNAILLTHRDELFALYKDQIKMVFNPTPNPFPEKDELLEKLRGGYLTHRGSQKTN